MSLLDDARRMLAIGPLGDNSGGEYGEICIYCSAFPDGCRRTPPSDHTPDCPWFSMPKIVAALEAADALTIAYEEARILFGAPLGYQFKALCEKLDEALDA